MVLSYQELIDRGTTRWDRGRFRVEHAPLKLRNWLLVGLTLIILVVILSLVSMNY
jgi:hypothetical protein